MSKRFAILENNVVENLATAEEEMYLVLVLPEGSTFIEETSFTGPAAIGKRYSPTLNKFESPRPSEQWVWDEATFEWVSPVAYPSDGENYYWDDQTSSWIEFPKPLEDPSTTE